MTLYHQKPRPTRAELNLQVDHIRLRLSRAKILTERIIYLIDEATTAPADVTTALVNAARESNTWVETIEEELVEAAQRAEEYEV